MHRDPMGSQGSRRLHGSQRRRRNVKKLVIEKKNSLLGKIPKKAPVHPQSESRADLETAHMGCQPRGELGRLPGVVQVEGDNDRIFHGFPSWASHLPIASAASPAPTLVTFLVFLSTSSTWFPSARDFLPTFTRRGIPIKSASLNLLPGRSSLSSIKTSTPAAARLE